MHAELSAEFIDAGGGKVHAEQLCAGLHIDEVAQHFDHDEAVQGVDGGIGRRSEYIRLHAESIRETIREALEQSGEFGEKRAGRSSNQLTLGLGIEQHARGLLHCCEAEHGIGIADAVERGRLCFGQGVVEELTRTGRAREGIELNADTGTHQSATISEHLRQLGSRAGVMAELLHQRRNLIERQCLHDTGAGTESPGFERRAGDVQAVGRFGCGGWRIGSRRGDERAEILEGARVGIKAFGRLKELSGRGHAGYATGGIVRQQIDEVAGGGDLQATRFELETEFRIVEGELRPNILAVRPADLHRTIEAHVAIRPQREPERSARANAEAG